MVHDVSEIGGPVAATADAAVTLTLTVDGVTSCSVSTDGASASLTQPTIGDASGSFTDLADADKSYTLTCAGVEGSIVRTFDLDVLTVDDIVVPAIVTYGDSLVVTAAVDPAATCALVSTAPDGTDRRAEGSATTVIDGEARTFTLANVTAARSYLVECSAGEATAASAPAAVRINPALDMIDAWQVTTIGLANGVDDFTLRNNPVMRMFFTASVHTMDIAGQFVVTGNPAMTCTFIVGTYCNLEVRDNTPTVSNNASASCAGIYSTC